MSGIAANDVGQTVGEIMINPNMYIHKIVKFECTEYTWAGLAKMLSTILKKKIAYEQVSYATAKKNMLECRGYTESLASGILEYFKLLDSSEPALCEHPSSSMEPVTPSSITLEDWLESVKDAFSS